MSHKEKNVAYFQLIFLSLFFLAIILLLLLYYFVNDYSQKPRIEEFKTCNHKAKFLVNE